MRMVASVFLLKKRFIKATSLLYNGPALEEAMLTSMKSVLSPARIAILGTGICSLIAVQATAQVSPQQFLIEKPGATISIEPYGKSIVRITLSINKQAALAAPGYGIVGKAEAEGWQAAKEGADPVFRSSELVVDVEGEKSAAGHPAFPEAWKPLGRFFGGSVPGAHISLKRPDGSILTELTGWGQAVPNQKDATAYLASERRPTDDPFYVVSATFSAPDDEHYYGLGQNQEGFLDHRGHTVHCWNDYNAPGGQSTCIPFLITNKGYGILWDNPSKTTIIPGFNERTSWQSEVGDRVSFFVIAGKTPDEIYAGLKQLTGPTVMLPKSALGYIQCKQRYGNQQELLDVARQYRKRNLPADVMVVDWFYYTEMGQMDFDHNFWPDPKAMNDELHKLGYETMISVWPRFVPEDRYYAELRSKGWLIQKADGSPIDGLPYDKAGADIDTTNPDAAEWYWQTIKSNILSVGFDSLWADETEPDLPVDGAYYKIGPGTRYFNLYPLTHVGALYDRSRRDMPEKRSLVLSRDAYTGLQSKGAILWSSDIAPTWDTYRRQIPTGLGVAASGFTYWSNDTGGWGFLPEKHTPAHQPLLDPSDARKIVGGYDDYPELYTRWFQYASFLPIFRTHGSRLENETWSYGKAAEPILEKYLQLRYELMPYIYSLSYQTWQTGVPFMKALPIAFSGDEKVADIRDEYMFGPAFLVAPVTEQGATSRSVYLPKGSDWYNYWSGEKLHGGQQITVHAPIDTLPLFVKAGSILPLGSVVLSTHEKQSIQRLKIYPGADAQFSLFDDDGSSYAYEKGAGQKTLLRWDNKSGKLSREGTLADQAKVEIVK